MCAPTCCCYMRQGGSAVVTLVPDNKKDLTLIIDSGAWSLYFLPLFCIWVSSRFSGVYP